MLRSTRIQFIQLSSTAATLKGILGPWAGFVTGSTSYKLVGYINVQRHSFVNEQVLVIRCTNYCGIIWLVLFFLVVSNGVSHA